MHGNVWEWCQDWNGSGYYAQSPQNDPSGPRSGSYRVARGGGWAGPAGNCRSANRGGDGPGNRDNGQGFRLVRALSDLPVTPSPTGAGQGGSPRPEPPGVAAGGSGATAALPATRQADLGGGVKMDLVLIPSGEFMMGSSDGDSDEKPVHKVQIGRPLYMGKYEVTQEQWERVMGSNPNRLKGARNPVENVSWNDSQEFINKLNAKGQGTFRLPTEAEWEYACRAGTTTTFHSGSNDSDLRAAAWFNGNSGSKPHPVGEKQPNAWGLYDMHGNVWEWCQSLYKSYPYRADDGRESVTSSDRRVLRGGSWLNEQGNCRSTFRYRYGPGNRFDYFGFRVVVE
jgi:formylglycine-generating enzyme required for sulfatase activity